MITITDSIQIDAPVEVVWRVTQDVERWPEWTPTVTSVRVVGGGELRLGSVALIKQPAQPESPWTVTELVPGRRFAWETRRTGLHLTAIHELTPADGGTRNVLTVKASGFLSVVLLLLVRLAMRRALAEENRGLKARCEQELMHLTDGLISPDVRAALRGVSAG